MNKRELTRIAGDVKDDQVIIRVSKSEKSLLKQAAKSLNMSLSDLVRAKLFGLEKTENDLQDQAILETIRKTITEARLIQHE